MNGSTNAQNVLRSPISAIIRYSGTTVTVAGHHQRRDVNPEQHVAAGEPQPRERVAASTENVIWPSSITAVINAVTATARPNPAPARSA